MRSSDLDRRGIAKNGDGSGRASCMEIQSWSALGTSEKHDTLRARHRSQRRAHSPCMRAGLRRDRVCSAVASACGCACALGRVRPIYGDFGHSRPYSTHTVLRYELWALQTVSRSHPASTDVARPAGGQGAPGRPPGAASGSAARAARRRAHRIRRPYADGEHNHAGDWCTARGRASHSLPSTGHCARTATCMTRTASPSSPSQHPLSVSRVAPCVSGWVGAVTH